MESIKFYKLVSPYPEDETLNCKLTMSDMDLNFLTFKNFDVKDAYYYPETMKIEIVRNNGDKIVIDMSSIADFVDNEIEEALSGYTPSSGGCEVDISGELGDDGVLTLSWTSKDTTKSTTISGFLTKDNLYHDSTLDGTGDKANPLRLSDMEKTGRYKSVLGIVNELPTTNLSIGDRYITSGLFYEFGKMYSREGVEITKEALNSESSLWRIPTQDDWVKLFKYAEVCEDEQGEYDGSSYDDGNYGEYVGSIAGSVLKSKEYWTGNENSDNFGFRALPAGYGENGESVASYSEARFWTDTIGSIPDNKYVIYGFSGNHDDVLYDLSTGQRWYSIRLVKDITDKNLESRENILGNIYGITNIEEIGQAWTTENLNYDAGSSVCEQYYFVLDGIKSYFINQWDGNKWIRKELEDGDEISVIADNGIETYTYTVNNRGHGNLVAGSSYKLINNDWRMVIDCGTY